MKQYLLLIIILIASVSFASAVSPPVDYNGKQYYIVTSTDPTEDTGAEVCAKIGKTCVGYTEESTAVCKLFHPSAITTLSMSGDKAGVFCDGAPQTGVCAEKTNACHECPACTNTVDCNTQIGNLYREMFVECVGELPGTPASNCPVKIKSKNTKDFFQEIPSLDTDLSICPLELSGTLNLALGGGVIRIDIKMNDNSFKSFYLKKSGKKITSISVKAPGNLNYKVSTNEKAVDEVLTSNNKFRTYSRLYADKEITIKGVNLWPKIKLFFIKPILNIIAKRNRPPLNQTLGPGPGGAGGGSVSTPSECFETEPRAHIGYQENHALWDRYTSETTNVCQSAYGRGVPVSGRDVPSPCIHIVQLSRDGNPYYLCWYGRRAVPTPLPADIGRPRDCDDTTYQAHRGYQQNSELWDRYMADSTGVCQSVYGRGVPSPCKYIVQLSSAGKPYYLCWYD